MHRFIGIGSKKSYQLKKDLEKWLEHVNTNSKSDQLVTNRSNKRLVMLALNTVNQLKTSSPSEFPHSYKLLLS